MATIELKTNKREVTGKKVKHLREQGLVPAVVYGHGLDTTMLQVEAKELRKVLAEAGTYQLISLQVDQAKPKMALARDIQKDYIRGDYIHVDFYAVKMDEKVTARVPLVLEGEAPGARDKGGVLIQGIDELEIECLPADLISALSVNVEDLHEYGDTITVTDLNVPDSVTVLSDPESMVAKVEPPRIIATEEEMAEELEGVSVEPEVLTEARSEEEDEEEE